MSLPGGTIPGGPGSLWGGGVGGGGTIIPVYVGRGILYPALRRAGITLGPQRTPSPAQYQDAIEELNRLTGSLNCDRLFIYSKFDAIFPLTDSRSYTIGASADPNIAADFDSPRPEGIEAANIVTGDGFRYPLRIVTDLQWAKVQPIAGMFPEVLYNDRAYPLSRLYLSGQPPSGSFLELFFWQLVPQFLSPDDQVLLPPGYEDALVLNLALRLAPNFQRVIDPTLRMDARESLMRLESLNAPQPIASLDNWGSCGCDSNGAVIVSGGGGSNGSGGGVGPPGPPGPQGPPGPAGATDLDYLGDYVPGTYNDGDIVVAADGIAYMCVKSGVTTPPEPWPGGGIGGGAVASVFGRTGAVVAVATDYTPAFIGAAAASHVHAAADITTGVMAVARLGTGTPDATNFLRGDGSWQVPAGGGGAVSSVFTRTGAVVAASGDYAAFYAATVHTHAAADITSGVIAVARLGTGTPSSANYLRGDGSWQAVAAGANQTPWTSNINGGGFSLTNVSSVGVGVTPLATFQVSGSAAIYSNTTATAGAPVGGSLYLGDSVFAGSSGYWNSAPGMSAVYAAPVFNAGDLAFYVYNGAAASRSEVMRLVASSSGVFRVGILKTAPTYTLDVAGDCNLSTGSVYRVNGVQHVHAGTDITTGLINVARLGTGTPSSANYLRGDGSWQVVAAGANQTPWTSDINGATFNLNNAGKIECAMSVTFDPTYSYAGLVIREPGRGGYSGGGPEYAPRIALSWSGANTTQIAMISDGTVCIWDNNGTGYRPFACGTLSPKNLPSAAPAAGSKQLWYDPADSNRVKYAP